MSLHDHQHFSGSAEELAQLALASAKLLKLKLPADKVNERLVRYYVTEGVLDRPERVGRDAAYGYRHLLQLLTARRMTDSGIALAVVATHNQAATTKALQESLSRPVPTAAELLVGQFMGDAGTSKGSVRASTTRASWAATSSSQKAGPSTSVPARPQLALPDVLDEVRRMKSDMLDRMDALDRRISAHDNKTVMAETVMQSSVKPLTTKDLEQALRPVTEHLIHHLQMLIHEQHQLAQTVRKLHERLDALQTTADDTIVKTPRRPTKTGEES